MRKAIFLLFVLAVVLTALFYLDIAPYSKEERFLVEKETWELVEKENVEAKECFTIKEDIVNGNSLSGIVENGQTVTILFGYYNCNEIKRGDIIVYNYAGNKNPIIKIAKGLPGDKFSLKKTEDLAGWNIVINNEIVVNSDNQPYILDDQKYKMLSLYEESYNGIIPENSYLILGNLPQGTIDSTLFGLISKNDILGKVNIAY